MLFKFVCCCEVLKAKFVTGFTHDYLPTKKCVIINAP